MLKARSLFLILALAAAIPLQAEVVSIATARSLSAGTVVTVEGSVTVASGTFSSSMSDQGFAIHDLTGGLYVSLNENLKLEIQRRVRVTGTLGDDGAGLLVLRPASKEAIEILPEGSPVIPGKVATGSVNEETEGLIVEVTGTVSQPIVDDRPYGYKIFVNDGSGETQVFIAVSTGVDPSQIPFLKQGSTITAVGYGGQYKSQYEVLIRVHDDIRPAH
jgi:DNA/RNA endonuclease YhcR with UshA esterase domain